MTEQWIDADDVPDAHDVLCRHCGQFMAWEDCDQCDDGFLDVYEDDPLWFRPGDVEVCHQCDGYGGWWYCDNTRCPAKVA